MGTNLEQKPNDDKSGLSASVTLRKQDVVTRLFSITSIVLVLLAAPLIVTLAKSLHGNFVTVFELWTYVSVSTLIILSFLSIYDMLRKEAKKTKEGDLSEIKHDLSFLFRYKHITAPSLTLLLVAGLGFASHFFSSLFDLQLVYTAVIVLLFETIFHSAYRIWPRFLKERRAIQNTILVVLVLLGVFISLFLIGESAVFLVSIIFVGIILVGGIGLAFIVNTVASDLSHFSIKKKNLGYDSLIVFYVFVAVWTWYTSDFANTLFKPFSRSILPHLATYFREEFQALISGLNISFLSISLALLIGVSYLAYLLLKNKARQGMGNFIFLITSIPIVGFIFIYMAILTDGDWIATVSSGNGYSSYLLQLIPSIVLFVVGYSQIMIELPRKTSRVLQLEESKFIASITWLIILSALAEFLSWTIFGQPGEFIFEVDIVQWFGIPVGVVLLSYAYLKKR